jgi:membrane-associated phospholipid phosphatase
MFSVGDTELLFFVVPDISYRFGRLCRTLHDVSQQRITMLAVLAFALVGIAVKLKLLVPFDQAVEAWTQRHITPLHTTLMLTATELASIGFVSAVTALAAAVMAHRRSGYWLGRLALSVPGGVLLNEVLKYVLHRSRPVLEHPLVELPSYSFPSGHAVGATVFYGFAAILLWSYIVPRVWRIVIGTAIVVVILMVGFSRVYLGAHYSTDVLAGILEGVAWLSFVGMITNRHRPVTTETTLAAKAAGLGSHIPRRAFTTDNHVRRRNSERSRSSVETTPGTSINTDTPSIALTKFAW